jgi:pantoate kinase
MKTATAFSPCNITGFFRIHNDPVDPLRAGSTGASVALRTGVTTQVMVKPSRKSTVCASFNDRPLSKKSVSFYVTRKYLRLGRKQWSIEIIHTSRLPTGCGYGTSGAGALGLSLALNEVTGQSLNRVEAAQIAHVSEIACKTGLGTVTSVFSGGFGLRTSPGAPGVGKTTILPVPKKLRLVTATFGPIATSTVLKNDLIQKRVNMCGTELIERFDAGQLQTSFMELSRTFADCLSLMTQRLSRVVNRVDSIGFRSSMVMLGESLFCMAPVEETGEIADIVLAEGLVPTVSDVARYGAHLL